MTCLVTKKSYPTSMEEHATLTNISIKINFKGILLLKDFIMDCFAPGLYFFWVS